MASILGRLSTLIRSNVNDMIDGMQDPAKEIDQMVRDMEDSARQARTEVAACMAQEKQLEKQIETHDAAVTSWELRAVKAVQAGDDALAKEALRRKGEEDSARAEVKKALDEQNVQVEQLTAALKALDARVRDVKLRQGSLRERARTARDGSAVSTKTKAFEDFDRMSSKVDAIEAEAGLTDELGGRTPESEAAARKLDKLGEDQAIDDALASLKKKLSG